MNNYTIIQEHLGQVIAGSVDFASEAAGNFITTLNLGSLSDEEKLVKVHSELLALNQEIKNFDYPEYIFLGKYENAIEKLFYARLLFFQKDETEEIEKAILIHQKHIVLQQKYQELKRSYSKFSFSDFIAGKSNVIFYSFLECPSGTSNEEYLKMRTWQNNRLLELVQFETIHLIETFRNHFIKNELPVQLLTQEIEKLRVLFSNQHKNWLGFRTQLSSIIALKNITFPAVDSSLTFAFNQFLKHKIDFSTLTPQNLQKSISCYHSSDRVKKLSFPPVFIYSLIFYGQWLEMVRTGKISIHQNLNMNFLILFEETYNSALLQGEKNILEFRKNHPDRFHTTDEYQKVIITKLDKLRIALKELETINYFNLLDTPDSLLSEFISKCIFQRNPGVQAKQLRQAIIVNEESAFLLEELQKIYNHPIVVSPSIHYMLEAQMVDIILSMVPDNVTVNKVISVVNTTLSQLHKSRKPELFIIGDFKDESMELFNISYNRLIKLLNRKEHDEVWDYSIEHVKQLQRKMLDAERNKFSYHDSLKYLKRLLEIEKESRIHLHSIKPVNLARFLKPAVSYEKKLSFGLVPFNSKKLEAIMQALCLSINLLDNRTSVDDIMLVFKSKDLSLVTKKIYIDCETTQFRYILDKLNPYFESLKLVNIEKSKLFYTRNNKLMTASNLSRNNSKNPKQKDNIDRCFQ